MVRTTQRHGVTSESLKECPLTKHVSRHSQQSVHQVVNFSVALHDVSQLSVIHKHDVTTSVWRHVLKIP